MAGSDGTTPGDMAGRKDRPFVLKGQDIDRIVAIQDRTNPRLSQAEVIRLGIELADKHTKALQPRTKADLLAEIVGAA